MWQPQSPTESPRSPPGMVEVTPRTRNPGRRFGQVIRLKPECVDEYKACHVKIWPEVAQQIKTCNIEDLKRTRLTACPGGAWAVDSIWYDDKTGLLFASFKYLGYDYAGDMERMAESPKVQEWWKMTDSFQESLIDGASGSAAGAPGWWKPMEEVFYQP
ncbi:hypothetical protein HIM_04794 [Hirsutella minnesotensis 3608]|uniref:L-rhamnose mutarotase n=1 Tax=Hirsutella minnesotensis 3608 TaxID=1043627 RepID=A0A0F7ZPR7_9HYPO|nr:hypothetical protein HIM_04794 [Hirsutella minnesotensis 3608]